MGSKSSPKAPDYTGAAKEQAQSSKDITQWQTFANRPDLQTPWGSSQWEVERGVDPTTGKAIPNWTQTIGLSPEQQKSFDDQQAIQGGRSEIAKGLLGDANIEMDTPSDFWNTLPEIGQTPDVPGYYGKDLPSMGEFPDPTAQPGESFDFQGGYDQLNPYGQGPQVQGREQSAYNPDFAQTQYDRQMSLEGPRMEQQREAMDVRLRNQGLRPGTQAYDRAITDLRNQQGEQTSRMSQDAMGLGAREQQNEFQRQMASGQQRFGQEQQAGQYGDQQRGQQFGELGAMQGMFGGQANDRFQRELAAAQFANQQRGQAGQEQLAFGQQGFGQQMQQSQYQQQQRQQAIAEQMQREGWSLNKINAALSGQQVGMPQMPSFVPAQASQPANMLGAATAQGNFDTQNNPSGDIWGAVGSIGGGLMGGPFGAALGGSLLGGAGGK